MNNNHMILLGGEIRTDITKKQKVRDSFAVFRLKCGKGEIVTAAATGDLAATISAEYSNGAKLYAKGKLAKVELGLLTQKTEHIVFLIEELLPIEEMHYEYVNQFELEGTISNVIRNTKGYQMTLQLPIQGDAAFSISAQCQSTNSRNTMGSKHNFKGYLGNVYEYHPQFKNKIQRQLYVLNIRGKR